MKNIRKNKFQWYNQKYQLEYYSQFLSPYAKVMSCYKRSNLEPMEKLIKIARQFKLFDMQSDEIMQIKLHSFKLHQKFLRISIHQI